MNVKICGVTRVEDALTAAQSGAWAVGLVFDPASPRFLAARRARVISDALSSSVLKVGVFRDQALEEIRVVESAVHLDLIQLHGLRAGELCRALGAQRCIQAVVLNDADSVSAALELEAAYVLVDRPRTRRGPEGSGVDWGLASRLAKTRPRTILAGALTPENVRDGVIRAAPWGVDVSGGVESSPGVKDPGKIRAFVEAARSGEIQ